MTDKEKIKAKIEQLMYGYNLEADIASCENAEAEKLADIKYQLCKKMLEYINSLQEEPVSKDLEEAINAYIGYVPEVDECSSVYGKRQAFKAGANWQKQQMINGAVETIIDSKPNDYGEFMPIIHVKVGSSYKDGEKVRIIIIKEE